MDGNRGVQHKEAMGTILAARYNEGMVQEIMQMARSGDYCCGYEAQKAMGTILAARYNEGMVQEIMQMSRSGDVVDPWEGTRGNGHYTCCTL